MASSVPGVSPSFSSPSRSGTLVPWPAYWNTMTSPARLSATRALSWRTMASRVAWPLNRVRGGAKSSRVSAAAQPRASFTQPPSGALG